jgi:outer membrane lipoprotein SlyB
MNKSFILLPLAVIASVALSACTTPGVGGSDYTYRQVRGEQSVRLGTVESIRKVRIQAGEPGAVGILGGGIAGAAVGSTMGRGTGNSAATALGALAGAVAGEAIESKNAEQEGIELTIRLDSGYVIAVTQGMDEQFRVGDRVQVLGGAGATRVTRLDPNSSLNYTRPSAAPASPAPNMPPPPPQGGAAPAPQQILYFCPDSNQYYPAVPTCKSPWMKVVK